MHICYLAVSFEVQLTGATTMAVIPISRVLEDDFRREWVGEHGIPTPRFEEGELIGPTGFKMVVSATEPRMWGNMVKFGRQIVYSLRYPMGDKPGVQVGEARLDELLCNPDKWRAAYESGRFAKRRAR